MVSDNLRTGVFHIIFRLSRIKDNETVRQLRQLRWCGQQRKQPMAETAADARPRNGLMVLKKIKTIMMVAAGSANSQRPKQQRDTRPRNGLIVLMVLRLLKELSCHRVFRLIQNKDNETVRRLRQLRWLRTRTLTAKATTTETMA